MQIIQKYFPNLTQTQVNQFTKLYPLYEEWNAKINVVSRKDFEHLYERHILHSLAIAKFFSFTPKTQIIDIGTGGGFPGIPLAIMFPEVKFTLVDSIQKKITVVNEVKNGIGLQNVTAIASRAEQIPEKFDFIVSRAVTNFPDFLKLTQKLISSKSHNKFDNGIIYLKGGDLEPEAKPFLKKIISLDISDYFKEEFFETKRIIYYSNK
jgi:16S rRNA (guanine527-N7)-methyltransferase